MRNRTLLLVLSTLLAGCTLYSGQEATLDAGQMECPVPVDAATCVECPVPPDAAPLLLCADACVHNFLYSWICTANGFCLCNGPSTAILCSGLCDDLCSDQWHCDSYGFCSCNNGAMVCREAS